MNLSETYKEEIRNELNMIQQMEENNLLKDFILSINAFMV